MITTVLATDLSLDEKISGSECVVFGGQNIDETKTGYENCLEKGFRGICFMHRIISERWYSGLNCNAHFDYEDTYSGSLSCVNKPESGDYGFCQSPLELVDDVPLGSKFTAYRDEIICCKGLHTGEPSCSDGIRNGDEQGVDCGDSCPIKCSADSCNLNSDCDDKNACTFDICLGSPRICSNIEVNLGCNHNNSCVPVGVRGGELYCDTDRTMKSQLDANEQCENNYQCKSNFCVSNTCLSPNFMQKLINWFRNMFG